MIDINRSMNIGSNPAESIVIKIVGLGGAGSNALDRIILDGVESADLVAMNLNPAVVGCATAIRRFLAAGTQGAIVNVSSHQARQAVPGCTPYVTAKAAIEGLTRALAVEYGPRGIRVNAVAPGSVATERYEEFLGRQEPEAVTRIEEEMRLLHPPGRVARSQEVAAAIVYLLSDDASFINGATVPVDGGRSVLARDPEA